MAYKAKAGLGAKKGVDLARKNRTKSGSPTGKRISLSKKK